MDSSKSLHKLTQSIPETTGIEKRRREVEGRPLKSKGPAVCASIMSHPVTATPDMDHHPHIPGGGSTSARDSTESDLAEMMGAYHRTNYNNAEWYSSLQVSEPTGSVIICVVASTHIASPDGGSTTVLQSAGTACLIPPSTHSVTISFRCSQSQPSPCLWPFRG